MNLNDISVKNTVKKGCPYSTPQQKKVSVDILIFDAYSTVCEKHVMPNPHIRRCYLSSYHYV